MRSYFVSLKNHLSFSRTEWYILLVYSLLLSILFSLRLDENYDGLFYYLLLSFCALIIYFFTVKMMAIRTGNIATITFSYSAVFLSALFLLIDVDAVFFIPPFFMLTQNDRLMHGRNPYPKNMHDFVVIAQGVVLLPVFVFSLLSLFIGGSFMKDVFMVLFFLYLYTFIPFDALIKLFEKVSGNLLGTGVLYRSRTFFVGLSLFLISFYLMFRFTDALYSFFFSFIFAFVGGVFYFFKWE